MTLLEAYEALIRRWAPRLDLVSPGDLERLRTRHIDDSLRLLPLLGELRPGPCCDVGSGAGLPGVPLAIADPSRPWRLLEPRRSRAAFIEEVVRELSLANCTVVPVTAAEAAGRGDLAGAHALAVARALAPPAQSIALLRPLVLPGGVAVTFVGDGGRVPPGAEEWRPGIAIVRLDPTR